MFHSVGSEKLLFKKQLSVSISHFEHFCRFLKRKNYNTILLDEWYNLQNNNLFENNSIALTFDDGYLDNWVFAYPILKKYSLKGTVFINPELVDPFDKLRPNLEDVWKGNIKKNELKTFGFLSWPEIKKMDSKGILQAQSHSMSHNSYFKSDKLLDFYFEQPEYDWMNWYYNSGGKHNYPTENQASYILKGFPVFENDRALSIRRFYPYVDFIHSLTSHTKKMEKEEYPISEIKNHLFKIGKEYYNKFGKFGYYESEEDMENRYRYELFESKSILEEKLKHPVDFLCWPGGSYNDISMELSKAAGYKASTLPSKQKNHIIDNTESYKRIQRSGMGSFIYKNNKKIPAKLRNHLVFSYKAKKGHKLSKLILKMQKVFS